MPLYSGPIVDAHHHFWRHRPGARPWLDREPDLARDFGPAEHAAALAGITVTATVWIEALAADPLAEAAEAQAVAADMPHFCTAIVAHAPLDAPDLAARLDALEAAAPNLAGVRDIVAVRPDGSGFARAPDLLRRPAFLAGLAALAARGLVFDLMLEPHQMADALAAVDRVPDLAVAIEHAGSPDLATPEGTVLWREAMRRAALRPNVSVKLSALHCRMPGWTDAALAGPIRFLVATFGPERIAFATDFPVHDRHCPAARGLDTVRLALADLSGTEQRAIFHDTARRLYDI